jgi:AcrR family transcriptional regulator
VDKKTEGATVRKPRADGERNRALLMETAKKVFAEKGSQASLEQIARSAGVGIGTLYRHFPTRDALVAAVYANETGQLAEGARRLAETRPPVEALREWLMLFIDFMSTKHGMAEVFDAVVSPASALYADAGTQITAAVEMLVRQAVGSGEIALEIAPTDILRALAGIAGVSCGPDWETAARQLVDIIIAGVRVRG